MPGFRTGRPDISTGGGGGPVVVWTPDLSTATVVRATSKTYEDTPGHIVTIGPNLPAMDYRGLSVDAAHTNLLLWSQELSAVSWIDSAFGAGTATTTANAGVAPDGTTTADRVDVPAVAAGQRSAHGQLITGTAAPYTYSVWAKAVTPGSATYLFFVDNATGNVTGQTLIQPSTTQWTRYSVTGNLTATTYAISIGVFCVLASTQIPQAASSILYWGAQLEQNGFKRSHVATVGATATHNGDVVTMAATLIPVAAGQMDFTFIPLWGVPSEPSAVLLSTGTLTGTNGFALQVLTDRSVRVVCNGVVGTSGFLTWTAGQAYQFRITWGGGNWEVKRDGVTVLAAAGSMPTVHSLLTIGSVGGAAQADGYFSGMSFAA